MDLASVAAAGPGDVKVSREFKTKKKRGQLNVSAPLGKPRYVELPNGQTIWRPNAPGFPDLPGGLT